MDPIIARRIALPLLALLALFIGWQIGQGFLALAGLLGACLLLGGLVWFSGLDAGSLLGGCVLVGYLVGNRGFAQLSVPGLPLFAGEIALGIGMLVFLVQCARSKRIPFRRDFLNVAVLLWIIYASARLRFDVRAYGFMALRDFAMIYYTLFFFLAQSWVEGERSRNWIEGCLRWGLLLSAPVFVLFDLKQDWFLDYLSLAGNPLIYVKSDVAGGFMVGAALLSIERYRTGRKWSWLLLSAFCLAASIYANNRAALVGLCVALAWLGVFFRTGHARLVAGLGFAGLVLLVSLGLLSSRPFSQSPLVRLAESMVSIADIEGTTSYRTEDAAIKPDNNQFRIVWWKAVIDETRSQSPWTGLGFGYDLSDRFQSVYYPEGSAEFSARSPHNILVTTFGRLGFIGLSLFCLVLLALSLKTWRCGICSLRQEPYRPVLIRLLIAWVILITACFGVVLESPMGAIPFWIILGVASGSMGLAEKEAAPEEPQQLG